MSVVVVACSSSDPPADECAGESYVPRVHAAKLADLDQLKPFAFRSGAPGIEVQLLRAGTPANEVMNNLGAVARSYDSKGAYCPSLQVTVRLNSLVKDVALPGAWRCFGPSGATCVLQRVTLDDPAHATDDVFEISDSSATLRVPVGDLYVERTLTAMDGWTFRAGQTIALSWSYAADLVEPRSAYAEFVQPCAECPSGEREVDLGTVTIAGLTLSLTLPTDLIGSGTLKIFLSGHVTDRGSYFIYGAPEAFHEATITP